MKITLLNDPPNFSTKFQHFFPPNPVFSLLPNRAATTNIPSFGSIFFLLSNTPRTNKKVPAPNPVKGPPKQYIKARPGQSSPTKRDHLSIAHRNESSLQAGSCFFLLQKAERYCYYCCLVSCVAVWLCVCFFVQISVTVFWEHKFRVFFVDNFVN